MSNSKRSLGCLHEGNRGSVVQMKTLALCLSVFFSIASEGQVSSHGTVIDVIPFNGGVVVASDTRRIIDLTTKCDGVHKLIVPSGRKRTIVFESGSGLILQGTVKAPSDLCIWARSAHKALDISHIITSELDSRPQSSLSEPELKKIAGKCLSQTKSLDTSTLSRYRNDFMFSGLIVNYDAAGSRTLIGEITVFVDEKNVPYLKDVSLKVFGSDDLVRNTFYGDYDYITEHVLRTNDPQIIPYVRVFHKTISLISASDATDAAYSLVKTAENTALRIPSPEGGIGGPIDIAKITKTGIEIKRH